MTPFFLFRMWLKRASGAERASALGAVSVALALLVWVAVPGSTRASTSVGVYGGSGALSAGTGIDGTPTAGGSSATGAGASTGGPGAAGTGASSTGGTGAGTASGGTSSSGGAAATAAGTAGGATTEAGGTSTAGCTKAGSPIKLGIVLPNVGQGSSSINSFLGVPAPSEEQADYQAVINSVNKAGGVQCHPLVGDYATFNELDSSQAQTICLQFVQDGVYAVLGGFGPLAPDTCPLQNHIPTFEQIMISIADARKYYPYYFSTNGAYEVIVKNFVGAVNRLGYFSAAKGFKKIGVLERTCVASEMPTFTAALNAVGVTSSQIDVYNFNCGNGAVADPPNQIAQAELQFYQDGVTDVTAIGASTDLQDFTNDANNQYSVQHFKPYYMVPDDGSFATISATQNVPNGAQFDGAIGITGLQYGGIEAGFPEAPATKQCDAIMSAAGLPTVAQSGDNFAGSPCDLVWMLTDAMNQDPGLSQAGLAAGLAKVQSVAMSYPDGPNQFSSSVTWGGEDWREDVFQASCKCFVATSPNFNPSF